MTRSPRQLAQQKIQQRKQQEKLFTDLLAVVDALDRATDHWQKAQENAQENAQGDRVTSPALPPDALKTPVMNMQNWPLVLRLKRRLIEWLSGSPTVPAASLADTITSALDGTQMIRTSLLEILERHQVTPIPAHGHPFDPELMKALGQAVNDTVPPNTVIQEVVRGYRWRDRVLREAQVIVATGAIASQPNEQPDEDRNEDAVEG